jgi:hypothetical protein
MIYMVEMEFRDTAREHDWHTWYLAHTTQLVRNVPGFTATQRFRCLTPTPSPWLALHEVAGPEVFESAAYKANGGPASTGEWRDKHTNWYRNLFSGWEHTPDVRVDHHLIVAEAKADVPLGIKARMTWGASAGLDKTAERRGLAVLGHGELKASMFAIDGRRIFKPITPRITA